MMTEKKKRFFQKKAFVISICVFLAIGISLSVVRHYRTPIILYFMGSKTLPVVVVKGTWEEMGYQVGSRKEFAKDIHQLVKFFTMSVPAEKSFLYYEKVKHLLPASINEQMKGLAKGVSESMDIPFDEAWKDVIVWNFFIPNTYLKSCTAFAVTTPKGSYLAHNTDLDYLYGLGGAAIIFKPNPGLGHPFISFFNPGFCSVSLAENLEGLAVVFNAAYPNGRDYGIPPELFLRKVIAECSSIEEVVSSFDSFIRNGGRFAHNGSNSTFLDFKTGKMVRVEIAPDKVEFDYGTTDGDKKYVLATNHYRLMPERNGKDDFNTSSYARYERCRMLLETTDDFNMTSIFKILTDHDGKAYGTNHTICRHEDLNKGTINSIYFDGDFTLHYILGNPCNYLKDLSLLQTIRWKEMLEKS